MPDPSCHPTPITPFRAEWMKSGVAGVGVSAAATVVSLAAFATLGTAQSAPTVQGDDGLLVLAAASLADALPQVAEVWTARSGVGVRFSFDATSRLAPQAVAGAPADVFVAADGSWIRWLTERRAVEPEAPLAIAGNELVLVVPAGSPAPTGPSGLGEVGTIGLAGENVPAGRYAREALRSTGAWTAVEDRVVTGGSVRSVLEWVARGEVQAGVVYRTDALVEPGVSVAFGFAPSTHAPILYWAAPLATSRAGANAQAFVAFLGGEAGTEILGRAGFSPPTVPGADDVGTVGADGSVPAPSVQTLRAGAVLPSVGSAIRLSLLVALLATAAGLLPAIGLGWLLARHDFRGKVLVSTLVLAPLVIPPVVTGFLLLTVLGTQSPLGGALAGLGLPVPFTIIGAAVAALVVGLPLYVLSIRGAFEAIDPLYEELSWTLGHPPRRTFLRVSLPLALPGIAAGAILAFARSLGEFGATVVLAGNVEGSTRTIALAVYTLLESPSGRGATWTLVGASVALSLLALVGFETLSRRQRRRLSEDHGR